MTQGNAMDARPGTLPEADCAGCGETVPAGTGLTDAEQAWWLDAQRAARYHDADCHGLAWEAMNCV